MPQTLDEAIPFRPPARPAVRHSSERVKKSVPQVRARFLHLALRARALLFVCSPPARESS
ncbi:hypothetical protein AKJ08_0092 [Vulgatibacter incomptus]|uniref:Uncharacterized protein n=1 Tax=Vulgatibacter incomptus TaxID=1391653 RepID=A0A0K1P870_9BACT|nr:hypothetical protein AKJ08_0092 [Vulgatibacter incomptus]